MALRRIRHALFPMFLLIPLPALAQTPSTPAPAAADQLLKPAVLDALVAPIALYPDSLLAVVLMASSYPIEIVQADRWASVNKNLKGDQLKAAVDKQSWDDSVKSVVATPSVLSMMSTKLDWTQKLGDAVLAQQPDVMDAIQRLVAKAQSNNKLQTTKEQKVTVRREDNRQVIAIEPAVPDSVYVPYYDPAVAYGAWPDADDPPYYFGYPGYIAAGVIAGGIAFGAGYLVGRWASGGNFWGGGVNWGNRNIISNRPVNINNIGNNWQHNPAHRQGVRYNNANVAQRFGNNNIRSGSAQRMDFRGRDGQQVLNPGGDRGNRGDRGAANRPAGEHGAANRPGGDRGATNRQGGNRGAANRPGGDRSAANRPGKDRGGANRSGAARQRAGAAPRGGGARDNAFGNINRGQMARMHSARGQASLGGGAGFAGGGGFRGGGGGFGGGGGGFRGGGGGRRSDIALKHDVMLLGHLDSGVGFYRFSYVGSDKTYVGVIAQEVAAVMPQAVTRGPDGYLRVFYDRLGVKFQSYDAWIASGARVPAGVRIH